MSSLQPGQTIGKYTVQSLIKENLYTETYRAEDENHTPYFLKAFVTKRVPEKLVNSQTGTAYEIEYCRSINHRNIVSYIDSGTLEVEEGSVQYYLTNYFSGELLAERIQRTGKLPLDEALTIFRELLAGLQYLHQQSPSLSHNDVTPRNIMLTASTGGTPELIDLGHVSKACNGTTAFDTSDLDVIYSANETFIGTFDEQSDIFSACAVLFAMLTGKAPWTMDFPEGAKRSRKAMLLKDFRKDNPLNLDEVEADDRTKVILQKGLALSYNDRYRNVAALLQDLDGEQEPTAPETKKDSTSQRPDGQSTTRREAESPNLVDFEN